MSALTRWRHLVAACKAAGKHGTKLVYARATARNEWPADKYFCKFCECFVRYAEAR